MSKSSTGATSTSNTSSTLSRQSSNKASQKASSQEAHSSYGSSSNGAKTSNSSNNGAKNSSVGAKTSNSSNGAKISNGSNGSNGAKISNSSNGSNGANNSNGNNGNSSRHGTDKPVVHVIDSDDDADAETQSDKAPGSATGVTAQAALKGAAQSTQGSANKQSSSSAKGQAQTQSTHKMASSGQNSAPTNSTSSSSSESSASRKLTYDGTSDGGSQPPPQHNGHKAGNHFKESRTSHNKDEDASFPAKGKRSEARSKRKKALESSDEEGGDAAIGKEEEHVKRAVRVVQLSESHVDGLAMADECRSQAATRSLGVLDAGQAPTARGSSSAGDEGQKATNDVERDGGMSLCNDHEESHSYSADEACDAKELWQTSTSTAAAATASTIIFSAAAAGGAGRFGASDSDGGGHDVQEERGGDKAMQERKRGADKQCTGGSPSAEGSQDAQAVRGYGDAGHSSSSREAAVASQDHAAMAAPPKKPDCKAFSSENAHDENKADAADDTEDDECAESGSHNRDLTASCGQASGSHSPVAAVRPPADRAQAQGNVSSKQCHGSPRGGRELVQESADADMLATSGSRVSVPAERESGGDSSRAAAGSSTLTRVDCDQSRSAVTVDHCSPAKRGRVQEEGAPSPSSERKRAKVDSRGESKDCMHVDAGMPSHGLTGQAYAPACTLTGAARRVQELQERESGVDIVATQAQAKAAATQDALASEVWSANVVSSEHAHGEAHSRSETEGRHRPTAATRTAQVVEHAPDGVQQPASVTRSPDASIAAAAPGLSADARGSVPEASLGSPSSSASAAAAAVPSPRAAAAERTPPASSPGQTSSVNVQVAQCNRDEPVLRAVGAASTLGVAAAPAHLVQQRDEALQMLRGLLDSSLIGELGERLC
jgi:hypothetical protein